MERAAGAPQSVARYVIDLKWYEQNNRSFSELALNAVCIKCRKKLTAKGKEPKAADIISTIQSCCNKEPDFITNQQPLLSSIFRILLANGNQPMDIETLSQQLNQKRGGDITRASPQIVSRLLSDEQYYGIREIKG